MIHTLSPHQALQLKDEQVLELSRVREEMDREIEELTANLFVVIKNYFIYFHKIRRRACQGGYDVPSEK